MLQLIVFEAGSCQLAIKAENVVEIILAAEVTLIPQTELPFIGIINYRGKVVSMLLVRHLLGQNPALPGVNEQMIIVGNSGVAQLCLVVDRVVAFTTTDETQPLENLGNNAFQGRLTPELAKLDTALVPILAVEILLGPKGRAVASNMSSLPPTPLVEIDN